jgi:ABC-type molybdate transport system permease subunit
MASPANPRRLPPPVRKALLCAHLITAVGLLGVDFTLIALAVTGARGAEPATVYPAAQLLGTWLLLPLAVGSWLSGVALGLLTPWGIVKHWWVTIKFAFNSIGLVLAVTVLHPTLVRLADAAGAGVPVTAADRSRLIGAACGATTVLTLSVLLAVYKPFGRVRPRVGTRVAAAD